MWSFIKCNKINLDCLKNIKYLIIKNKLEPYSPKYEMTAAVSNVVSTANIIPPINNHNIFQIPVPIIDSPIIMNNDLSNNNKYNTYTNNNDNNQIYDKGKNEIIKLNNKEINNDLFIHNKNINKIETDNEKLSSKNIMINYLKNNNNSNDNMGNNIIISNENKLSDSEIKENVINNKINNHAIDKDKLNINALKTIEIDNNKLIHKSVNLNYNNPDNNNKNNMMKNISWNNEIININLSDNNFSSNHNLDINKINNKISNNNKINDLSLNNNKKNDNNLKNNNNDNNNSKMFNHNFNNQSINNMINMNLNKILQSDSTINLYNNLFNKTFNKNSKLPTKNLNINIIYYDKTDNTLEFNMNCLYFKLNIEGTFYGINNNFNLFEYICSKIKQNSKFFSINLFRFLFKRNF